jgi:hypothetical protein
MLLKLDLVQRELAAWRGRPRAAGTRA